MVESCYVKFFQFSLCDRFLCMKMMERETRDFNERRINKDGIYIWRKQQEGYKFVCGSVLHCNFIMVQLVVAMKVKGMTHNTMPVLLGSDIITGMLFKPNVIIAFT